MAEPLRTVDVGLRLLEMVALLFPVIIILVQTTLRLASSERQRALTRVFKVGLFLVGVALVYLYALSLSTIELLRTVLAENQFRTILDASLIVFSALFGGSILLLIDAFREGKARVGSADDDTEAGETTNTTQQELSDIESDDQ